LRAAPKWEWFITTQCGGNCRVCPRESGQCSAL